MRLWWDEARVGIGLRGGTGFGAQSRYGAHDWSSTRTLLFQAGNNAHDFVDDACSLVQISLVSIIVLDDNDTDKAELAKIDQCLSELPRMRRPFCTEDAPRSTV